MRNELYHHGIEGQKWGVRNGPPYPLTKEAKRKKTIADRIAVIPDVELKIGHAIITKILNAVGNKELASVADAEYEAYKKMASKNRIFYGLLFMR